MIKEKTSHWKIPMEIGEFRFSEFANCFHFCLVDGIGQAKETALAYLNSNYPDKAPFTLTRIETKNPHPEATGTNKYVPDNEIFICFEPLINTNWD